MYDSLAVLAVLVNSPRLYGLSRTYEYSGGESSPRLCKSRLSMSASSITVPARVVHRVVYAVKNRLRHRRRLALADVRLEPPRLVIDYVVTAAKRQPRLSAHDD